MCHSVCRACHTETQITPVTVSGTAVYVCVLDLDGLIYVYYITECSLSASAQLYCMITFL